MYEYQVAIIGSGPAGYTAAFEAAKQGLRTAVIEKNSHNLGGVCLNEGCIPLKGFIYHAEYTSDFAAIRKKVLKNREQIRRGLEWRLERNNIEIFEGEGKLLSSNRIQVGDKEIYADHIILAMGSQSRRMFQGPHVFGSTKMMDLEHLPGKILIIGGGVIGCEFASLFNRLGVEVHIVELMDALLKGEDPDIIKALTREFKKKKIKVMTESKVEVVLGNEARIITPKKEFSEHYDMIFEVTGRIPATYEAGIDEVGILQDEKGFILVNEFYQTAVPSIYAVGDCINTPMYAYSAYWEAEQAVYHISGKLKTPNQPVFPRIVFSSPQVGGVGISQQEAEQQGIIHNVYQLFFKSIGKAVMEERSSGLIKIIADPQSGVILGASASGEDITELMNELSIIINNGLTVQAVMDSPHVHPSYSEIVREALLYGKMD